jgi:hypothetical protein
MDLLALQDVLNPRRLITPEVESVVSAWVDVNASDLATLRARLHTWTADEPFEILEMTRAVAAKLQQLADRLPVIPEPASERGGLRHVSSWLAAGVHGSTCGFRPLPPGGNARRLRFEGP